MKFFTYIPAFLVIFLLTSLPSAVSQTNNIPNSMHFTAVARDAAGNPITGSIYIRIEIFDGMPNGNTNKIYCEQTPTMTNNFGEFSLDFPNVSEPLTSFCLAAGNTFNTLQWQTGNKWVKISFQPNGNAGGSYIDIAQFPFTTVPYAFAARNAEKLTNVDLTGALNGQILKYTNGTWKPGDDNTAASLSQSNLQQDLAYSVPSSLRGASWNEVRLSAATNNMQLQVPTTGLYLILSDLKVTGVQPADEEFQQRVLNSTTNIALIDEATVWQKNSLSVNTGKGELASWTIKQLAQGDLIKLQYRMLSSSTPPEQYSYSHGRLAIIKLQ